ncbi:MAG TPA: hypothetical protein PLF78_06560 [Caulobacter sp.]|nr:hypothetical protein [Caulobacter sp.]
MVLRSVGAGVIVRLLWSDREGDASTDWLLHGPTDPDVVEAEPDESPPLLLAAE